MLEDIDRIEVISGPGGTLWGANAMNGVINIITRQARATQGTLVAAGGGNLEAGGSVRHGGKFGADGHYRIYGKYFDRDNTERADGTDVPDAWQKGQIGFRADWGGSSRNFTLQGDAYSGELETLPSKTRIDGANLLGRWNQRLAGGSDFRLQTYIDHIERDIPNTFKEVLNIFDIEFQHGIPIGASQRVLWGGGYRYARDRVQNSMQLAFLPADKNLDWANVFVQDEIRLTETVELVAGIKFESNDYTGWETLPNLRLAWRPHAGQLLWTALSRAVRAPARLDRELFVPANPPFLLAGGPNFRSEIANVFEIGNRGQPSSSVSYSIAAFYQDYDHLRSVEAAPGATCVAILPGNTCVLGNLIEGTSKGVEAWGSYQVMQGWRLSAGALLLDVDLKAKPGSVDANPAALGNDPDYQWLLRSSHNLTPRHELDIILRSIDALPDPDVPSYTALDARLGWRPIRDVELSLTLQNLFDDSHPEFGPSATRSVFERGVFLKLVWRL
jgi:iron complex outermembrane receptor protein